VTASRRVAIAVALDVASIVVFVAIGRQEHDDDGNGGDNVLEIAAPFLIGLVAGWLVARAWRDPWSLRTGLVVWPVTVVVGMLLRRLVWDDGTALAFVIVASAFTALCLLGWRAIARLWSR
jgi:hypothetical protein